MDFTKLNQYCKHFSDLTETKEQLLKQIGPDFKPYFPAISEAFYTHLLAMDETKAFLEGRVDHLKKTHHNWLASLFTHDFNNEFAAQLYHVGHIHVKINLPSDFMTGSVTFLQQQLLQVAVYLYGSNPHQLLQVLQALNSVMGYNLQLMQLSYQESMVTAELSRFLKITGISHKLFANMVAAYKT